MSRRTPKDALRDALADVEVVVDYGAGDPDDQQAIDRTCMRLSAGIEALARLDPISWSSPRSSARPWNATFPR